MTDSATLRGALEACSSMASHQGAVLGNGGMWTTVPAEAFKVVKAAARAHLETLPKTKMVEVWRVECATAGGEPIVWAYLQKADAEKQARGVEGATNFRCIRVTGPHQQCVPV